VSLDFEDHPFERTRFDEPCALCGASGVYLDEVVTDDAGGRMFVCSDTDHCEQRRTEAGLDAAGLTPGSALSTSDGVTPAGSDPVGGQA
jgi:alpha-D-ribose 1-methylphosphonate 5-phosphate C-P lyase